MMLVLTRKEGEKIRIGDDIVITVVRSGSDKARIGIEAPPEMVILRSELQRKSVDKDGVLSSINELTSVLPLEDVSGSIKVAKCS